MLKKKAIKKIILATVALFLVLIIYTITDKPKEVVIYDDAHYTTSLDEVSVFSITKDNYISKASVYVDNDLSLEEKIKNVLEVMIEKNNKNSLLPDYLKPILPNDTKVLDVTIDNDIATINFSKELLNISEEQSNNMIESIIYTITDFDNILGITIKVEGKTLKYVPNTNTVLNEVLDKNYGINKVYSIYDNNNITKVILYYIANNTNNIYVPVTKYVNDTREKIEIIVEELSSSFILKNNLVSFLDSNVKLVDYSIDDNLIKLVFNESLYENSNQKKVNKDTLDMIALSVFDNYDVENAEIYIDSMKIYEKSRKDIEN